MEHSESNCIGMANPEMLMEKKIQPKKHDSCFAPHVQTIKQASTARRQTAWMKALYQKKKTQSYSSAGFTMGTEYKSVHLQKSVNLQYNTLGCLDDGTNQSSTKSLMFQVLFFFYTFYRLRALKTLYFYFCNFIKKK